MASQEGGGGGGEGRRGGRDERHWGNVLLCVLQPRLQVALLLPEAQAAPHQPRDGGLAGQRAGQETAGDEGPQRAVLPLQDLRGQVPLLLLCAQAQEAVAQGSVGAGAAAEDGRLEEIRRSGREC